MWMTSQLQISRLFVLFTEFRVFDSYGLLQMSEEEDNDELLELPSCDPFRTAKIQEVTVMW